jgi:endonuclease-8
MPEGDTIHRLAEKLRGAAQGKPVLAFSCHSIPDAVGDTLVGHVISEIVARGKNLLIRFDDGRALHIHLRMMGRVVVRTVRSSTPPPRSRVAPQLAMDVPFASIRGSRIPVLRLLASGAEARVPELRSLGPDLLAADFDLEVALLRLTALARTPIGEALMLQRVVAGIGNVYKSEVLFLEKVDPRAPVASLEPAILRGILERARKLLRANVRPGPRITRNSLSGPRTWVYGRARKACFTCRSAIVRIHQGAPPGRSTYFCPNCQQR